LWDLQKKLVRKSLLFKLQCRIAGSGEGEGGGGAEGVNSAPQTLLENVFFMQNFGLEIPKLSFAVQGTCQFEILVCQ
jgi:hypothetical protein